MDHAEPIFDPATGYRIEVRGPVDLEWLQSFDSSTALLIDEPGQRQEFTVFHVSTDQAGMIGLLRRLHGLGITILQIRIVTRKEE